MAALREECAGSRSKLVLAETAVRAARQVQGEMSELRVYCSQQERIVHLLSAELERKGKAQVSLLVYLCTVLTFHANSADHLTHIMTRPPTLASF